MSVYLKKLLLFLLLFPSCYVFCQDHRKVEELKNGWLFANKEISNAAQIQIDSKDWAKVSVPHDWAIAGPFSKDNDPQLVQVKEDGETKEQIRIGRTGGLPYIGIGWYRKTLQIPESDKGKCVAIEFDGAMSNAKVFLNNQYVGEWPYGYSSFSFDITKFVDWKGPNILAVRLENFKGSSRWYPGAGIYRNVRLVTTNPIHVAHWGTTITNTLQNTSKSTVHIKTRICNNTGYNKSVEVTNTIYNLEGRKVGSSTSIKSLNDSSELSQNISVAHPLLWSAEHPQTYYTLTTIKSSGNLIDSYKTVFGIRSITFSATEGMLVNGKKTKLKGVCLHDDLGALGVAFNRAALKHHLLLLKKMGCNAIRGTHNPHAPEMLDLCDEIGFYYIDETFDEWQIPKVENGYHLLFDKWAKKDVQAMIYRDKNHPALIMYSIGNEIKEANTTDGSKVAKYLADICRAADPTRPTTAGLNILAPSIDNGFADAVDIPGWNYKPKFYGEIHRLLPNKAMYGSETASTVSSRGSYQLPAALAAMKIWPDNQASSYDLEYCSWSQVPDVEWQSQKENDFVMGEFVWTGVDYLGEPSPYNDNWPSRSSYFGIIDLAGIPKDRYFLYQSQWSSSKVLHILPHWNWPGKEGKVVPVYVYTNYPSAELFINGKSYGKKTFNNHSLLDSHRLRWENAIYQPGELKVVAYDKTGKIVESKIIRTAGEPCKIILKPDRNVLRPDGADLSYVTVSIVDKDGNLCPNANNLVSFKVIGEGYLRAVDNGNSSSMEPFQANFRKAFNGKCMAIIQGEAKPGEIKIIANSEGLKSCTIKLATK